MEQLKKEITFTRDDNSEARWYCWRNDEKGETIEVCVHTCKTSPSDKKSLPNLWLKHKLTSKKLYNYLHVQCYVTGDDGICREKYNPTIKESEDGKRLVLNFDCDFEATEEAEIKILNEIYRRSKM